MEIDTDKLETLFEERYKVLVTNQAWNAVNWDWTDYCDKYEIIMLHGEWLVETLNEGKMEGRVCIHNCEEIYHENVSPWLLVPKEFAERCLVLGGLP